MRIGTIPCSPLGSLADVELDLCAERGMAKGGVMSKLRLFGLCRFFATFHDRPPFSQMPKTAIRNSEINMPEVPGDILGEANSLSEYELSWCHRLWARHVVEDALISRKLRLKIKISN